MSRWWVPLIVVALAATSCADPQRPSVDASPTVSGAGPTSTIGEPLPPATTAEAPTSTTAPTTTAAPSYCTKGTFTIDEGAAGIVDPDGEWFLPSGVNLIAGNHFDNSFWQNNSSLEMTADDVAVMRDVWNFNTIRININSADNPAIWDDVELHRVIGLLTDAGMVSMIENHPYGTGLDPTAEEITITTDGFASLARRYVDNACVWFNPYNEPGGKLPWEGARGSVYHVNADGGAVDTNRAWVDWHVPVIEAIRAESDAVIVLDDTHFGQGRVGNEYSPEDSAVLVYGPELNAAYDNLLYAVHFYDRWGGDVVDLNQFFSDVAGAGLALVAGEVGGNPDVGPGYVIGYWPTAQAFFEVSPPGVGVLLWHGNIPWGTGMSVGAQPATPGRVAAWDVTTREGTAAAGTLFWDWAQSPPAPIPAS